ncbi:hypothetical protein HAX54_021203 [Datura stramonium]|uniref:Uncharacterized protein n=1 Tax=Datura stramonium TaxID=4076 RepID=A0ABS8S6J9_DATST|nr:hypothetical protein [Datura stramonium]
MNHHRESTFNYGMNTNLIMDKTKGKRSKNPELAWTNQLLSKFISFNGKVCAYVKDLQSTTHAVKSGDEYTNMASSEREAEQGRAPWRLAAPADAGAMAACGTPCCKRDG